VFAFVIRSRPRRRWRADRCRRAEVRRRLEFRSDKRWRGAQIEQRKRARGSVERGVEEIDCDAGKRTSVERGDRESSADLSGPRFELKRRPVRCELGLPEMVSPIAEGGLDIPVCGAGKDEREGGMTEIEQHEIGDAPAVKHQEVDSRQFAMQEGQMSQRIAPTRVDVSKVRREV